MSKNAARMAVKSRITNRDNIAMPGTAGPRQKGASGRASNRFSGKIQPTVAPADKTGPAGPIVQPPWVHRPNGAPSREGPVGRPTGVSPVHPIETVLSVTVTKPLRHRALGVTGSSCS